MRKMSIDIYNFRNGYSCKHELGEDDFLRVVVSQ